MLSHAQGQQLQDARHVRRLARQGDTTPTSGMAQGVVQANLLSIPKEWAYDFLIFAQRNPKSCPVLEVLEDGNFESKLAPHSDLRTDVPRYRVWRDGQVVDEPQDVTDYWAEHPDLVTFLLGCSFTFEAGLVAANIEIRHQSTGRNVPMYRTALDAEPAGRLTGKMVVSMRPIPAHRVADAVQISGRFPAVHGAPVHVGAPEALGIADLYQPDYGDAPVELRDDEVPVFWACGVTPQAALMATKVPFAITHAPGHMFVTDVLNESYEV